MKKQFLIILFLGSIFSFTACSSDDIEEDIEVGETENPEPEVDDEVDDEESTDLQIKSFIYRGLNDVYLYKSDVAELDDDFLEGDEEEKEFLDNYSSPEGLFNSLLSNQDRFSYIVDDYQELEDQFDGISGATGIDFGLGRISGTNNLFGFIRYILPETSAEKAGLERGTVFTEVDGIALTEANYFELLSRETFTIDIAYVENGALRLTDETATLSDDPYTMNPVFITKVLEIENRKIGYLMYNSFIANFDEELNAAFAELKSEGVTDLVLDLRYNGGGSVNTATALASMITGQFEGQVFAKERWNEDYQNYYENFSPDRLVNEFDSKLNSGENINSLNLNEVYILTTGSTASASELIINGLSPHINVVQIGGQTTGKFQASITLYDSPSFGEENRSEEHTYAMQPLVLKMANADGYTDFVDGLTPNIVLEEELGNLGTLGDPEEPFLARAIDEILGRKSVQSKRFSTNSFNFTQIGESGMMKPNYQKMYIDKIPGMRE
ncbi:S41 family peptidase [Zunongwangia endophytica]|uniref:S41 family peptidase n=1 Tax=Zunongwangia endophytica TaxID=1808945 RepID=A0ABV8HFE6_9FLAO|nr:S41 family peptidase [Zunongwangia endophytica]MDN3596635.1 S41 family peptidase [Zunongwangia endophytica]